MKASADRLVAIALMALCVIGIFLRIPPQNFERGEPLQCVSAVHPQPGWTGVGFDEGLYRRYVDTLIAGGLTSYPDTVDTYRNVQRRLTGSILPPVRFLYILAAYSWHVLFGCDALTSLRCVAAFFSALMLLLTTVFVWRLKGRAWALAATTLMVFAPTQIHMSQHALVDGFFTFWAMLTLWLLWENLRAPGDWRWVGAYLAAFALLVLTKENWFFVWVGIVAVVVANRWLRFGTITRELLVATVVGPLLGAVVLVFLAGGVRELISTYQLSVSKNYTLQYAILNGDGPWQRYVVDLILVSPVVTLLAFGQICRLRLEDKASLFFAVFIAATYLLMCNIKYGMNLRYANMWDLPLRFLACGLIFDLASWLGRYRIAAATCGIVLLAGLELRQYIVMFVQFPMYELVTEALLRALHILKTP